MSADGPVGVALITRGLCHKRGPITLRTLHIGTAGEPHTDTVRVEHNRLLADPRHRAAFAHALLREAGRIERRCDLIMLDAFVPEDAEVFLAADPSFVAFPEPCHYADLAALRTQGLTVLDGLRRHTGAKIRRTIRRLEEQHGPLRVEWATSLPQAEAIFAELRDLHQERWARQGQPGVFASQRFTGFHEELIRRLHPQGRATLARVVAGDHTVGCDYGLVEHGRILGYQWGLATFEDSRLSPGLAVGALVMQEALVRGFAEYDWLAGDVLYKRELSTRSRTLITARAIRGSRMHVLDRLTRAKRSLASRGKSLPGLSFWRGLS
jgi:CelD/BcsL family acetyltransferase involved in cellulose biosynthesis